MKHKIGVFHLLMIGLGGIIGSGWLFSSMYASHYAGSGSYVAWIVGALLMLLFCLCLSELVSLYPKRGMLASVCSFSHNKDFAFLIGIANWFGTVAVIPTEALATARYLDWPHWSIMILIAMYALLNTWGVKIFVRFNSAVTLFKIAVPIITVVALFWHSRSLGNYHASDFKNVHNILGAIIAGGIIYGFNGVQMIVNFTSEAKRPKRDIPIALFLSLGLGLLLYLALQAAFLNSGDISFHYQSPFVELVAALSMGWMVILLQVGAVVSPSGAGFSYIASSTRMLTALSNVGQLPRYFSRLHPKYHMSQRSLIANTLLSLLFFFVFKTWVGLVVVVSAFHLLSYLAGPMAVGKLRRTMPDNERMFKMWFAPILCPLLFVVISVLFVYAGWHNDMIVTVIMFAFQATYLLINYRGKALLAAIERSAFLPIWLLVFTLIAFMGKLLVVAIPVAIIFYYVAVLGKFLPGPEQVAVTDEEIS